MPTRVDPWQAHVTRSIRAIAATVDGLVERGVNDRWLPPARHPTRKEQDRTDRADGMFRSTPTSPGRGHTVSDPTNRAVETWETDVQQAATVLWDLVCDAQTLVETFRLATPAPPVPDLVHHEATYRAPERFTVNLDPERCRLWATEAADWLIDMTGQLARVLPAELDQDRATGHAEWWRSTCRRAHRKLDVPAPKQKRLVYCRYHPDRLAKYRRAELCQSCYDSVRV